jgi:hypothetical protein
LVAQKPQETRHDLSFFAAQSIMARSCSHVTWTPSQRRDALLTENEVSRSWAKLFKGGQLSDDCFQRAELLLDELRTTSPLRHRLQSELEEIRSRFCQQEVKA